ncbi:ras guanine-nucleotide exchange protein-like protein [Aulographum hederae CBS 113979]|uniref:Ras guanine-nucleotide exchange protein-like protein n=1 Tax=Aulographum hederae CBS 113979 TaxID=1176131 RepID=A0A6G1H0T2_9PEZI|nr:ras guanine-nucleotide exchange protein-like protein [Aulographum hederae CBS 113979]
MSTLRDHANRTDDPSQSQLLSDVSRSKSFSSKSVASGHTRASSGKTARSPSLKSSAQISPPMTPRSSRDLNRTRPESPSTFHNYLRAFHHFHPTSTVSSSTQESSITVPINQGDVILVHSIHPNGWADGTLLASGARGWLPTNYCEAYDHPSIRNLLNALTHLWDRIRTGSRDNLSIFTRQDYVRGMIAGVRLFLETTRCLNRESHLVQTHVGLRRLRKGLLSDLSALVKISKQLQALVQSNVEVGSVFETLDELVLKAFKVVIRAVRFLDIWSQDVAQQNLSFTGEPIDRPLTPPVDPLESSNESLSMQEQTPASVEVASLSPSESADAQSGAEFGNQAPQKQTQHVEPQEDTIEPNLSSSLDRRSLYSARPMSFHGKRVSVSHRVSYAGKLNGLKLENLASERLSSNHDAFLGFIGSFIGLHLQSRSSTELFATTSQSVTACKSLLNVVDEIWERDGRRSEALSESRDTMYDKLAELVQATKGLFSPSTSGEDVFLPEQGKRLVAAATSCVRAAGDCVNQARAVIEKIGDFEFGEIGLGISTITSEEVEKPTTKKEAKHKPVRSVDTISGAQKPLPAPPAPPQPTSAPPPPPLEIPETKTLQTTKPLPKTPLLSLSPTLPPPIVLEPELKDEDDDATPSASLAVFPTEPTPFQMAVAEEATLEPNESPVSTSGRSFGPDMRTDSVNVSVAESSSTYRSSLQDDAASSLSRTSTRATTPDRSPEQHAPGPTLLSSFGSVTELQSLASEDVAGAEEEILEKTFAHELVYNKDGQITGGSLPALVEQLTTHDSTPDAMFVTTFYLTFRLFTTPQEFAQTLVDRFEYIGHSPEVGIPVRLRVYNVFKGWMETHWQGDADVGALGTILQFATGRLRSVLPMAGNRLTELAKKVTELRAGTLVPRLVSSLGKTSTSVTVFSAENSNIPNPNISKSQLNALRNMQNGGSPCSILDFDPLELARQFTIIESRIFCAIGPEELLASEWTKKHDSKAVHVRAMSTLSTDLANLVVDTILHHEEMKKRSIVLKQWIKIACKCLELNNYDSLMAIVCSLNSSMVLRLRKTWEVLSQKNKNRFDDLKAIVDVSRNYAVLRQRLQNHVAPCIPFVGIYLTDLTFVDVGNQTTRQLPGDGSNEGASVINFDKHMRTAKIIGQLQRFQVPYRLAAVPEMQDWMDSQIKRVRSSDNASVQSYYRRSLLLEPREAPPQQRPSPAESNVSTFSSASRNTSKEKLDLWANWHFGTATNMNAKDPNKDKF